MRTRLAFGLAGLLLVPVLLGSDCADPGYRDTAKCSPTGSCPPGQVCTADGQCLEPCGTPDCTGRDCDCQGYFHSGDGWEYTCIDGLCHVICTVPCAAAAMTCDSNAGVCRPSCSNLDSCVNGATCVSDAQSGERFCSGQPSGGARDGGT